MPAHDANAWREAVGPYLLGGWASLHWPPGHNPPEGHDDPDGQRGRSEGGSSPSSQREATERPLVPIDGAVPQRAVLILAVTLTDGGAAEQVAEGLYGLLSSTEVLGVESFDGYGWRSDGVR